MGSQSLSCEVQGYKAERHSLQSEHSLQPVMHGDRKRHRQRLRQKQKYNIAMKTRIRSAQEDRRGKVRKGKAEFDQEVYEMTESKTLIDGGNLP